MDSSIKALTETPPVKTAPSPFVEGTNFQFAWDSVSLGYLKECPRKYYLTTVLGYRSKTESIHLIFGAHYAKAMERFYKFRADGTSYDDALNAVVKLTMEESYDMPTDHNLKTRETLIRSIVWYFEAYKVDDETTTKVIHLADGRPAVELSFKLPTGLLINGVELLYCGHLDRVVEFAGDRYVMDQKTTGSTLGSYYFAQFNPDNQMSGYSVASRVLFNAPVQGVIIDAAQVAVGFTRFGRAITTRTDAQLEEWLEDFRDWTFLAARYADRNHWPMNDKSCHKYGGCPFRDVCSHDKAVRHQFLETHFEINRWNPLEDR
jgi:PD-(D/E)XK nuclease superfamily protein